MHEIKMSKELKDAYESLKKEVESLEESGSKKLISNSTYKEMKMAVTIMDLTRGLCPDCQDRPIDPGLLGTLYFPFCIVRVPNFGKKPKKRKEFIKKKIKELQEIKV